ncbi:MAG: hypothetical protein AB7P07_11725 [Hyphomonadaceae bacterium]
MAQAPAQAGAWIAPEGGQLIWTETAGERDEALYMESSIYLERPIHERVALVAAPWVTSDDFTAGWDGLRWETTLGAKAAVLRRPGQVMAVQGAAVWHSDPFGTCEETGIELRWLGGAAFGDGRGFLNLEAAQRSFEGGCRTGRYDLTLGYRPDEGWLGMAQFFFDDPELGESALKAQLTLVRFGASGRGVQVGLRGRVDGEAVEPALVLGFWGVGRE